VACPLTGPTKIDVLKALQNMFKLLQGLQGSCYYILLSIAQSIEAKSLWATFPANGSESINITYPTGNGRFAAMPIGPAEIETLH
jgi:hypothetical protein